MRSYLDLVPCREVKTNTNEELQRTFSDTDDPFPLSPISGVGLCDEVRFVGIERTIYEESKS